LPDAALAPYPACMLHNSRLLHKSVLC
jgi:hypothetical protein